MKKYPLIAIAIFLMTEATVADTILFEDFEDDTITYTGPDNLSDLGGLDWYGRIAPDTSALPPGFAYSNPQGSGFYGVHDTDGVAGGSLSLVQLDFADIDVSNFENLSLSWFVAEDFDSGFPGGNWDSTTSFRIYTQADNGGFNQIFGIEAQNNSGNVLPAVDTNFDGLGDGAVITSMFTQFSTMLADATELDIRVVFQDLNTSGEDLAFDNLLLQGDLKSTGTTPVPEPTTFAAFGLGLIGYVGYPPQICQEIGCS